MLGPLATSETAKELADPDLSLPEDPESCLVRPGHPDPHPALALHKGGVCQVKVQAGTASLCRHTPSFHSPGLSRQPQTHPQQPQAPEARVQEGEAEHTRRVE